MQRKQRNDNNKILRNLQTSRRFDSSATLQLIRAIFGRGLVTGFWSRHLRRLLTGTDDATLVARLH